MTNYYGDSEFGREPWWILELELGERAMLDMAWENFHWHSNRVRFLVHAWTQRHG